jgi:hypothetical protein
MPNLILGLAALVVALWLVNAFTKASPAKLASLTRGAGGVGGILGAVLLALRGQIGLGMLLAGFALYLLGYRRSPFGSGGFGGFNWGGFGGAGGSRSTAKSASVEMELDHGSGGMTGRATAGPFAGRGLDELSQPELMSFLAYCVASDPEGARLLEAYLDRRFAGWRAAGEGEADARGGAAGGRRAGAGGMTEDEAYEVLGLAKGAGRDEIARAHRELMKKLHPDAGGSTHLAARVNEAKDVLLRRHT